MIHSLAGGELGKVSYYDYAKVEILEGENSGKIYWYKCKINNLQPDDLVIVPVGINNALVKAKVIRIDKNVSSQCSPVPSRHAKEIVKKI